MMKNYGTEQEVFWAGEFGQEYIKRNTLSPERYAGTINFWSSVLRHLSTPPTSVLELGANIGNNLKALSVLLPNARLAAVEINPTAAEYLRQWGKAEVFEESILNFSPEQQYDLVFTAGVLIHINPEALDQVYQLMHSASSRHICLAEYYSPNPEEIPYRGHREKMFRRDFAGDLLETFPDLTLKGYGFIYHRDLSFYGGDETWFLLEK